MLYRGRVPRLTSDNFTCCHTRERVETMTSVSAGHIILTPTQPVGSGRPQGDQTQDLLPRSRVLYQLSYRASLIFIQTASLDVGKISTVTVCLHHHSSALTLESFTPELLWSLSLSPTKYTALHGTVNRHVKHTPTHSVQALLKQ